MIRSLLALLSLALVVGPVAHGLYLHNFNFAGYLLPDLKGTEAALRALGRGGLDVKYVGPTLKEVSLSEQYMILELSFVVRNNLPLALKVEGLRGCVACIDHGQPLGEGVLSGPVEVPPGEVRPLVIDIHVASPGMEHVMSYHTYLTEQGLAVGLVARFSADLSLSLGGVRVEAEAVDFGAFSMSFRLGG